MCVAPSTKTRMPDYEHERSNSDEQQYEARNSEWLAKVSHELRSPLTTIVYALEVILDDSELNDAARRAGSVAERQARKAIRLVEDLLDVCADSQGKLVVRKDVVELSAIVAGATETIDFQLTERGHRLTVSLPPKPVYLFADRLRLEQVLTNLLTNAAKFTDPGGDIRLSAEVEGRNIVIRVRDNGRGIAPDLLPRLFDLFHQCLRSGDEVSRGLGIGLALVKSLVELHGGSVAVFSAGSGRGAEFVVRLPANSFA